MRHDQVPPGAVRCSSASDFSLPARCSLARCCHGSRAALAARHDVRAGQPQRADRQRRSRSCIAFWIRLSIETYPGIRRSYVILPGGADRARHRRRLVRADPLSLRPPRTCRRLPAARRLALPSLHLCRAEGAAADRGGAVRRRSSGSTEIDGVDWHVLKRPRLHDARACHAIVADFSADMPDEWEAFLADAALAGRIVYQVKQLSESLTGRVEIEHLSENSFGSLLPARGYFHLEGLDRFPVRAAAAATRAAGDGGRRGRDPRSTARAGAVPPEACRPCRQADHRLQVPDHAPGRRRGRAQRGDDRATTTIASPGSAGCCASSGSTSCRRSSTS